MAEYKTKMLKTTAENFLPITHSDFVFVSDNVTLTEYLKAELNKKVDKNNTIINNSTTVFKSPLTTAFGGGVGICAISLPTFPKGKYMLKVRTALKNGYSEFNFSLEVSSNLWVYGKQKGIKNGINELDLCNVARLNNKNYLLLGQVGTNWVDSIIELESAIINSTDVVDTNFSAEIVSNIGVFDDLQQIEVL